MKIDFQIVHDLNLYIMGVFYCLSEPVTRVFHIYF